MQGYFGVPYGAVALPSCSARSAAGRGATEADQTRVGRLLGGTLITDLNGRDPRGWSPLELSALAPRTLLQFNTYCTVNTVHLPQHKYV